MNYPSIGLVCAALMLPTVPAYASGEPDTKPQSGAAEAPVSLEDVLKAYQDLQRRVETLEKQHQEDQKRLESFENQAAPAPQQYDTSPNQTQDSTSYTDSQSAQNDSPWQIGSDQSSNQLHRPSTGSGISLSEAANVLGQGNLYNPSVTIFGDVGVSLSSDGNDKTSNRFNLREFELDARAAIAPFADGVFIATFGEEIGDNGSGGVDVATVTDVEEGYIDFHALPYDLTGKIGKFRSAFGAGNPLHTHDTPQVDRPLVEQAFLGPEGLASVGASLSWLVPNPWDEFIEVTGQVINADGGEESPILGGPNADNPAYLGHLKWFTDVGDYGSLELGGSYLYTHTSDQENFDANLFGFDATLKLPDPDAPDIRSFLVQGEVYSAQNDIYDSTTGTGSRNDSFGAYLFAQWQFNKNWYAGIRGDYTEFPNSDIYGPSDSEWAVSPYLTWYPAEFLRLRLEYQHNQFDTSAGSFDNDELMLQFTFVLGAHPPHPYWVNK